MPFTKRQPDAWRCWWIPPTLRRFAVSFCRLTTRPRRDLSIRNCLIEMFFLSVESLKRNFDSFLSSNPSQTLMNLSAKAAWVLTASCSVPRSKLVASHQESHTHHTFTSQHRSPLVSGLLISNFRLPTFTCFVGQFGTPLAI